MGERDSGTRRKPNTVVTTAIGTFTRKIGRQLRPTMLADTRIPPSAWPLTWPMAMVMPKMPRAMRRSRGGKLTRMIDSTCGTISAAAAPWKSRATTRMSLVGARPDTAEATANAAMPRKKTRRRP